MLLPRLSTDLFTPPVRAPILHSATAECLPFLVVDRIAAVFKRLCGPDRNKPGPPHNRIRDRSIRHSPSAASALSAR